MKFFILTLGLSEIFTGVLSFFFFDAARLIRDFFVYDLHGGHTGAIGGLFWFGLLFLTLLATGLFNVKIANKKINKEIINTALIELTLFVFFLIIFFSPNILPGYDPENWVIGFFGYLVLVPLMIIVCLRKAIQSTQANQQ